MKISIIIINFNTREIIKQCLNSLFISYPKELQRKEYEIVVVDNASRDGSERMIKQEFPQVRLIVNKKNIGFAKANNMAVAETQGDYVLFLNPDTVVNSEALSITQKIMVKDAKIGVATCRVVLPNGEIDDACHRGFPTPWRALTHFSGLGTLFPNSYFFNGYHLGYQHLDQVHEIDACAGAYLMIKRNVGSKIGWFDEDYFWYGDDLDLCFRVKQAGFKVIFVPGAAIKHYKGVASGLKDHSSSISSADMETKLLATQARFAVMRIFYSKHYAKHYPLWLQKLIFWGIDFKQKFAEKSL